MQHHIRRIYLWLVTAGVVAGVFLLINIINKREPITVEEPPQITLPDVNAGQVGTIGNVGIAQLQEPVFIHRTDSGQVDREVRFAKLVQAVGDNWEVEKPKLTFFMSTFDCIVTADRADIQTEIVAGKPNPKDAALRDNVVAHIVGKNGSPVAESFVYLDDIAFESGSSRGYTAGPVKFVSRDVQLNGRGLELLYNSQQSRLEFLRIQTLDSLKLRILSKASPAKNYTASSNLDKEQGRQGNVLAADEGSGKIKLYQCIFDNNVVIDSPKHLFLTDRFSIENIEVSSSSKERSPSQEGENTGKTETVELDSAAAAKGEYLDVVVTCDGGITFTPMGSQEAIAKTKPGHSVTGGRGLERYGKADGKNILEAQAIVYQAPSNIVNFKGDCLGTSYKGDSSFARRYTIAAANIEAKLSNESRGTQDYVEGIEHLRADGGVVRLAVEKMEKGQRLGFTKIKCFAFDYDPAEELIMATGPGLIAVDNSRLSQVESENIKSKNYQKPDDFSLRRPCWAIVENFSTLKYFLRREQILAEGSTDRMNIGYMPADASGQENVIKATVGSADIRMTTAADGRADLLSMRCSNGVTYDEQAPKTVKEKKKSIQLIGSDLLYDRTSQQDPVIKVRGNDKWSCFLNGAPVDGIEYHLKSGTLKEVRIRGPAVIW